MKRIKILFSLIAFVAIMVSCNKDEASSADGFATVSFRNIGVDSEVISTITPSRSGEEGQTDEEVPDGNEDGQENTDGSEGGENGGTETEEPFDPIAEAVKNGFKLSVVTHDETVYACTDYEKYDNGECENVELRVGNYTVFADLGNPEVEGFEQPYYSGSKDIHLDKGDNVDVDLECKLANSILKINYTENFKKYFSTYSSYVSTSKGNTVEYVQDETRGAYMASGEVTVYVKAKKMGANEATLNVGKYTLNPQYEYALTLDVDASNAIMKVTFSENWEDESVIINVSDAALNANAPYMVGEGVESGVEFTIVEGVALNETLKVTINAEAEIASCLMTTTSDYLKGKGWSESVDLTSADESTMSAIKASGVDLKGFSGSLSQMAYLDFTELVRALPKESPVDVRLTVTDKFGKVSEEFVFLAEIQDCMFSVSSTNEEAPFLGNECKVNVTLLEGDVNNVQFALSDGGQPLSVQEISEPVNVDGVNQYTMTLKGTDDMQFINPFKVNAKYLTYDKDTETDLNVSYGILLDNGEGDVWAKRAYMHVYNVPQDEMQSLKVQKKEVNGDWTDIDIQNLEVSGTNLIAKGLSSNIQQQLRVIKDGKEPTNILDFKTEEELQVPNKGFEEWSSKDLYSTIGTIKGFYVWNEGTADDKKFWDTSNTLTTPNPGSGTTWFYRSYPGVVPTKAESKYTHSYHWRENGKVSNLTTEGHSGNAMEIATVGWGTSNTWISGSRPVKERTAGRLFVGSYDDSGFNMGKAFKSRPLKVKFWYKYYSYNNEQTSPYVVVYDDNGVEIGRGSMNISNTVNTFTQGEINILYNKNKKANKILIVFESTNSQTPSTKDIEGPAWGIVGYWDSRHIGSILTVDDVELIYE